MPSNIVLPADVNFHEDRELERYYERCELARNRVTVSDILSEVDHLIADESDERKHPLYALVKYVLRHGGYRQTGQRTHMADFLTAKFENLVEDAIENLVREELANFGPWED